MRTRLPLFLTAAVLAAAVLFWATKFQQNSRAAARLAEFQHSLESTQVAIREAQRTRDEARREIESLEQIVRQKAVEVSPAAALVAADPIGSEWQQKAARLRSFMAAHPEWAIPEIGRLTGEEFVVFARNLALESEEDGRMALRNLRVMAKQKVALELQSAVGRYAKANGDRLPTTMEALADHFDSPMPAEILQRYEVTARGVLNPPGPLLNTWLLAERVAVDPDHDTRQLVGKVMVSQMQTNPSIYTLSRAIEKYAQINQGRKPASFPELQPLLDGSGDPDLLAKYFAGWLAHPASFGSTAFRSNGPRMMISGLGTR